MNTTISRISRPLAGLLLGLALGAPALAAGDKAADKDSTMLALANKSGCLTCHALETGAKGPEGLPPIGPAWRAVAAKYRGDAKAPGALTQVVLKGSSPYDSHWKGQASGLAMPPNAVAISPKDADALVRWILQLQAR